MQVCFFALARVLPVEEAIAQIKKSIADTWGKRGPEVVRRNVDAVDAALAELHEVAIPAAVTARRTAGRPCPTAAPEFVQRVTRLLLEGHGDQLPGQCLSAGRNLADGNQPLRKARHRSGDSDLGTRSVRAVQSLRHDLSARGDSCESV